MTKSRSVPPVVRASLRPRTACCYRHCAKPVRGFPLAVPLPGTALIYACPGGVVSVTTYVERTEDDPTRALRAVLQTHCRPPRLVRAFDLRLATRHGPELGRNAERRLARDRPPRPVRVVYWRVYPFRDREGEELRVFVCRRHGDRGPVFYPYAATAVRGECPVCRAARAACETRARRV